MFLWMIPLEAALARIEWAFRRVSSVAWFDSAASRRPLTALRRRVRMILFRALRTMFCRFRFFADLIFATVVDFSLTRRSMKALEGPPHRA